MRLTGLAVICLATELAAGMPGVSAGDAEAYEGVQIPGVTGMSEKDAQAELSRVRLRDGSEIEIITSYKYCDETPEGKVCQQNPAGDVDEQSAGKVEITVSLGREPEEYPPVESGETGKLSGFGLAEAVAADAVNTTNYRLGIDWDKLPSSYEYDWDNSESCWYYGVWTDGVCYKTPVGEYSTDVRHKMQFYCAGGYAYLHIIFGRNFEQKFNGEDYEFWIDNRIAMFEIALTDGGSLTGNTGALAPGTYQVQVQHGDGGLAYEAVPDALAYYTKYENDINGELELRIPLSEMKRQNPNIDLENMESIRFITPNLMYRFLGASGADTLPLLWAGAAFLLVPGSCALLWRRTGGKKRL